MMSVEGAGPALVRTTASMLAEIETNTAAEVVTVLRYSTAPPGPTFVPALDAILGEARPHPGGSTLQQGDLVELVGSSGSGKTTFVNFLLLTTILPSSMDLVLPPPAHRQIQIPLGGRGTRAALVHPSTHRSSLISLVKAIRAHLILSVQDALSGHLRPRNITPAIQKDIEAIIHSSLQRLQVIKHKPRWKPLVLALKTLLSPSRIQLETIDSAGDRPLTLVAIDGVGDGFWPERWNGEERGAVQSSHRGVRGAEDVGVREMMETVAELRRELGSIVVLNVQGLWASSSNNFFRPHLPPPYPAPFAPPRQEDSSILTRYPLNVQITLLGRIRPLQLPADQTLVDAFRSVDINHASKANPTQVFESIVRIPGGAGLAGTTGGVRFDWRIGQDGLEVWGS